MKADRKVGAAADNRELVTVVDEAERPTFSLCAMITSWQEYEECRATFLTRGFNGDTSEYLVIDNSEGNRADAYVATNAFLMRAKGEYVVLHHQDVRLIDHDQVELSARLEELSALDPDWAICGNAGALRDGWPVFNLAHPANGHHVQGGPLPVRVMSLDENFLVIKRAANLAASHDLRGFHHYGADLCMVADLLGWNAYVIDFFLLHLSGGTIDHSYYESLDAISKKYSRAYRPRWIELVTTLPFYVSGSKFRAKMAPPIRLLRKLFHLTPRARHFANYTGDYPSRLRKI